MALGRKTGGRQAFTPNRRTLELAERLEAAGFDPVRVVIEIARDVAAAPELRLRAASELLPYLFPRRKAVELSTAGEALMHSVHEIRFVEPNPVNR